MQTILVAGGAGFIGSNFVRFLLQQTDHVQILNLDKLTYAGNLENLRDIENDSRYEFFHTDIADREKLEEIFKAYEISGVINFAAETHVDRSIADSDPFVMANIIGTHNLLELSRKYQIERYHQVSTDEVYGDLGDHADGTERTYFREDTPLAPNCPYAATKASSDLLVLSWVETYGLNAVITRCSNNYGPYQFPEKLIPFFLFRAMNHESLPLYGDGLNVRDWLYVLDHCEAIWKVYNDSPSGEIWNIGGFNEKTNLEIVEQIKNLVPGCTSEVQFVPDRAAHDRRYAMDPTKLQTQLGWRPKHTFEQALPKTIEWYLTHKDWAEACRAKI